MALSLVARAHEGARAVLGDRRAKTLAVLGLAESLFIGLVVGWGVAFAFATAIAALIHGILAIGWINAKSPGNERMVEIATAIQQSAQADLRCQHETIAKAGAVLFLAIGFVLGWSVAFGFGIGALLSGAIGFIGMNVTARANCRTAEAARLGMNAAFTVAFRGGAITGLLVVGFGLLGVAGFYTLLKTAAVKDALSPLVGLAFGGSLIAIFDRLGGGIFAKGANVGADLFETYVATLVATMLLGGLLAESYESAIIYPLVLGGISILASIVAALFVRIAAGHKIMHGLYKGVVISGGLSALASYPVTLYMFSGGLAMGGMAVSAHGIFLSAIIGLLLAAAIAIIAEYRTATEFRPVRHNSEASATGHATNTLDGLGISMKSTAAPVLAICASIWGAHQLAGLYGIAIAATAMLSITAMIVALDAYGLITGNIAEMAGLSKGVRDTVYPLDAVGNTAKALAKGFAIGSAGLAALVLFADYTQKLDGYVAFDLSNYKIIMGLFIGGLVPYWVGALAMEAVDRAAEGSAGKARRWFQAMPGIMNFIAKPDYSRAVDMPTRAETIAPSLPPVAVPILVGLVLGKEALGGVMIGAIVTGLLLAISMTTSATVGDTHKDTAGPAINRTIKLIGIVALLIVPLL